MGGIFTGTGVFMAMGYHEDVVTVKCWCELAGIDPCFIYISYLERYHPCTLYLRVIFFFYSIFIVGHTRGGLTGI